MRLKRLICALVVAATLAGCRTELYTELGEEEANEIVSILHRHGIDADRRTVVQGSVTVRVEEGRFADAVDLLRGLGYPRRQYSSLGDVFSGEGFVVSPLEERARLIYGLTEELARTISDVDGVLSARVHVVLPTSDRFSQDRMPSSAAVFIRHDGAIDLGPLVPQIKLLVANSIEGLGYEKVSVVLVPVSIAAPTPTAGVAMGRNGAVVGMAPALVGAGLGGAGLAIGAGLLALRLRRSHAKAGEGTGLVTVPVK